MQAALSYFQHALVQHFAHTSDSPDAATRLRALHDRMTRLRVHLDLAANLFSGRGPVVTALERAPASDASRSLQAVAAAALSVGGTHVEYRSTSTAACHLFAHGVSELLMYRCLELSFDERSDFFAFYYLHGTRGRMLCHRADADGADSFLSTLHDGLVAPVHLPPTTLILVDDPLLAGLDWAASGVKTLVVVG